MLLTTETLVSSHIEKGMISQYKNDEEQGMEEWQQRTEVITQNKKWYPSKYNQKLRSG